MLQSFYAEQIKEMKQMAFQTKRPPIQMELSKNTFNKLVELLNYNA